MVKRIGLKLGEHLVSHFGWDQDLVREGLQRQIMDFPAAPRLGEILRELEPDRAEDIDLALSRQAEERRAQPDVLMREVESLHRLGEVERGDMTRRVRWYGTLLIGLVVYSWYPLIWFSSLDGSATHAAPGGWAWRWSIAVRAYGAMGTALVLFCWFAGDYLVKSFGTFLKLRLRLMKARRSMRAEAVRLGWLPQTSMPTRGAILDAEPPERPDPDFSRFHNWLPVFYTAFSTLKLGLLAFFLCLVRCGAIRPDRRSAYDALWAVCALAVIWTFLSGAMCMRYKRTLIEGEMISAARPFPRIDTRSLRDTAEASRWKGAYVAWGTVQLVFLAGYWSVAAQADAPWYLLAATCWVLVAFAMRILEIKRRTRSLRMAAGLAKPTSPTNA